MTNKHFPNRNRRIILFRIFLFLCVVAGVNYIFLLHSWEGGTFYITAATLVKDLAQV
jgi:hypothetical protein